MCAVYLFLLQVKSIQDDVDHYYDSCLEPDFEENDYIYDDLDLDIEEISECRIWT